MSIVRNHGLVTFVALPSSEESPTQKILPCVLVVVVMWLAWLIWLVWLVYSFGLPYCDLGLGIVTYVTYVSIW